MAYHAVDYRNIHFMEPEGQPCVMLYWAEKNRYLPIWVSNEQAQSFLDIEEDDPPRRPRALDLVVEIVTLGTEGVQDIRIVSQNEGEFYASVILHNDVDIDCRASDAILLALMFDVELVVEESVLSQCSISIPPEDVKNYLGFDVEAGDDADVSASGDALADADFLEMMANMGVNEEDLFKDDNEDDK